MSAQGSQLQIERRWLMGETVVLEPSGTLDSTSYITLRDSIIKESVAEPRSIVVKVDRLAVPAESAWAVFTSARWHIATWPNVPMSIVATDSDVRATLARNGITRYIPCYSDVDDALADPRSTPVRRRAAVELAPGAAGGVVARTLIREALEAWEMDEFASVCCIVGTHLIEMVAPVTEQSKLRIEASRDAITLAIDDPERRMRVRGETPHGTPAISDLGVLTSLCQNWGTLPDISGRRVLWAVCGRDNIL